VRDFRARALMFRRLLGGDGCVHCVWSQVNLAGPCDRSGIDKDLVEERCVGERRKNAGELIAFQAYASGESVLESDEQVIASLRLYFDDVPVDVVLGPGPRLPSSLRVV